MVDLITLDSPSPDTDHQPQPSAVSPEHEKKFLPSAEFPLPELSGGLEILHFYFPSDNIVISGNGLFYKGGKKAFLNLSDADLTMVKMFLSSPKPPKARIRMTERQNHYQAFFNMKLDQRLLNGEPLADSESSAVIRNLEFELLMPFAMAEKLYYRFGGQTHRVISKTRHLIHHNVQLEGRLHSPYSKPFEIDIFHGPDHFHPRDRKIADNEGLKMIELEFGENEIFDPTHAPQWLGEDVTHDKRYTNSRLSQDPFAKWSPKDQPEVLRKPLSLD